jgi:hypothetical protein
MENFKRKFLTSDMLIKVVLVVAIVGACVLLERCGVVG